MPRDILLLKPLTINRTQISERHSCVVHLLLELLLLLMMMMMMLLLLLMLLWQRFID